MVSRVSEIVSTANCDPESASLTLRYRARWALPIDAPPIENAEIVVRDGRIIEVGHAGNGLVDQDFGEAVIIPGFVNVHAHLEYTVMRGLLEDMPFFPWIRLLTALKSHITPKEWLASALLGAWEMRSSGITTIGDACDGGFSLMALLMTGQSGIIYREVFGISPDEPIQEIVSSLQKKVASMTETVTQAGSDRIRIGISPHAPYTVRGELFEALGSFAKRYSLPQTIHLAESLAEEDLFQKGIGPFAEMFARRGIAWETPQLSPTRFLDACGAITPGTLAVHCVQVSQEDIALLKARGATVAHCPKSNGKLGSGFAPVRAMLNAGLAVGLGTDSVASNNNADMFEEMRSAVFTARARERDPMALTAEEALRLATLGGAEAMGMAQEIGSLTPGKRADFCVVNLSASHITPAEDNPVAALVFSARASDVIATFINGTVNRKSQEIEEAVSIMRMTRRKLRDALSLEQSKLEKMMTGTPRNA